MNTVQNGFQAVGIMHGFQSEPWRNDPTKFNHRILLANPFLDGNGFQQTEVLSIDIAHDDVQRVQQLANELKGKQVILPCCQLATKTDPPLARKIDPPSSFIF